MSMKNSQASGRRIVLSEMLMVCGDTEFLLKSEDDLGKLLRIMEEEKRGLRKLTYTQQNKDRKVPTDCKIILHRGEFQDVDKPGNLETIISQDYTKDTEIKA